MYSREQERGVAIIIVLTFVVITAGLVTSGVLLMKSSMDRSEVRFRRETQSAHFAQSGLTEALSWFRRQTTQPVVAFNPQRDLTASPQVLDTDDPEIGLVREFEIQDDIWGRYEVWKKDETDTDPKRLEFRRKYQVSDLSTERGSSSPGNVWLVRCIAYVFQRRDATKSWNEKPNRVLAVSTLESEIERPTFSIPGQSALSIDIGTHCNVSGNGQLVGGASSAGVFYPAGTGTPHGLTGPGPGKNPKKVTNIIGNPALSPTSSYKGGVENVFGVTQAELRAMADIIITDRNDLPDPMPAGTIVYMDCNAKIAGPPMLNGGPCILFVNGNISMTASAYGRFQGLIYAKGNVSLRDDVEIRGAVVLEGGSFTASGNPDWCKVIYDDSVLSSLRSMMGSYRWTSAFRSVVSRE